MATLPGALRILMADQRKAWASKHNAATGLLARLGVYDAIILGRSVGYRGPTPERRKVGKAAGNFGKSMQAHFDRKRKEARRA